MKARHWFAARLTEAGLTPEIDGIGNVIGRASAGGPKLLLGSHLETQPYAGWLDGAMGVIYGLEVARALGRRHRCRRLGGRGGAFRLVPRQPLVLWPGRRGGDRRHRNRHNGTSLRDALRQAGWRGGRARCSTRRATSATSKRISSRATNSMHVRPASRRGDQHRRHAGISASASRACRTTPAPRAWRSARMPARRWCGWPAAIDAGSRRWRGRARVDHRPHHCWTPAPPASCPAARRCCSSSATPTRRVLDRLSAALEALVAEASARPLRG